MLVVGSEIRRVAVEDFLIVDEVGVVAFVLVFDLVAELGEERGAGVGRFHLNLQLLLQPIKLLRIILLQLLNPAFNTLPPRPSLNLMELLD